MDKEISKIIKEWKTEAGVKGIVQVSAFPNSRKTMKICTSKPGPMIGYHGSLYNKYEALLKSICPNLENIEFIETDKYYII